MRRLLKFLHTVGALGLMGAAASLIVLLNVAPGTAPPVRIALFEVMAEIGAWVFLPSLVATVLAGLLAIAANPAFHEAGWAWAKAATGVLMLEGGLHALGPIGAEARRGLVSGAAHLSGAPGSFSGERNTLWVLLAISTANTAFGVWRPRLTPRRSPAPAPALRPDPGATPVNIGESRPL